MLNYDEIAQILWWLFLLFWVFVLNDEIEVRIKICGVIISQKIVAVDNIDEK